MAPFAAGSPGAVVDLAVASALSNRHLDRCWQAVVTIACWLVFANRACAVDYTPIPLECLLAGSDAAVVAKLPALAEHDAYTVQVTKILRGNPPLGMLRVNEPAPWRGTPPHFESNEALLFLKHAADDQWEVSGPSGEGRVPLDAEHADITAIQMPVSGTGNSYSREPLLDALESAARCFTFERDNGRIRPISRCDKALLETMTGRSALHYGLFQRLLDAQQTGLPCKL